MTRDTRNAKTNFCQLALKSEFGRVFVDVDTHGNGPRLRIFSPRSGRSVLLDPLELESLVQWRHEDLEQLVLGRSYAAGADPDDRTMRGDP